VAGALITKVMFHSLQLFTYIWLFTLAALFYLSVNYTDAPNCCFIHRLMSPKLLLNSSVFHWWLTDSTRLSVLKK